MVWGPSLEIEVVENELWSDADPYTGRITHTNITSYSEKLGNSPGGGPRTSQLLSTVFTLLHSRMRGANIMFFKWITGG